MNSIKQTKAAIYPVRMVPLVGGVEQTNVSKEQMQGDVLWCTEMERYIGNLTPANAQYLCVYELHCM